MPKLYLLLISLLIMIGIVFQSWLPNLNAAEETKGGITDELGSLLSVSVHGNLYYHACATCHGVNGDGKGPSAYQLDPNPRDLALASFKCRTTPSGSLPTDADIFKAITKGIHGTTMPSWKPLLSERQIWNLVQYIKTFSTEYRDEEPEPPITIPEEIPVTPESINEGKKLYEANKCWECHGHEGKGDGEAAPDLEDDFGNRIEPTDFTKGIFRCGGSRTDLYKTIVTGLNGTPMPSYADSIPDDTQRWHLVHYIKSLERKRNLFDYLFKNDLRK
jgi:cytochrome c oxidase cbb3-type subunit 2